MNQVAKKVLLATVNLWDPIWIRWYRRQSGETAPIPPFKNRDRVGARDIAWFFQSGQADYQTFRQAITKWTGGNPADLSILDLGAGCGRILQYFVRDGGALTATDVDRTAIQYVARTFPAVRSIVNRSAPPLPLAAEQFDIVYAFSVWTHLPDRLQTEWLEEVRRILKPGGLALISTMGFRALKILREGGNPLEKDWHAVSDDDLSRRGAIYHEYPIFGRDDELFSGISESYGVAVHDPDYIRRSWSDGFEVLEIIEGAFRDHQDLVVLRKNSAPQQ
jgi:SAM-dependent methyltransferase